MEIRHRAVLPSIPGPDLLHRSKRTAERELANAKKAGHEGHYEEVLVKARSAA